jgi:hypothetical protein
MEKIFITGTGRCGTTFLIKLFTFLGFDTGFNEENYKRYVMPNCNAGMERVFTDRFGVLKNPTFLIDMEKIVKDKNVIIKQVIIPIRDYATSAQSRVHHGLHRGGGLWNATTEEEQVVFYHKMMSNYVYLMTKYNIPTIFIDFERMVTNKNYLFTTLRPLLEEKQIEFEFFSKVYDDVSLSSKPKR